MSEPPDYYPKIIYTPMRPRVDHPHPPDRYCRLCSPEEETRARDRLCLMDWYCMWGECALCRSPHCAGKCEGYDVTPEDIKERQEVRREAEKKGIGLIGHVRIAGGFGTTGWITDGEKE